MPRPISKSRNWKEAEKLFGTLCVQADCIASGPDEDANGWDFLVEFSKNTNVSLLEIVPQGKKAFVQVKSVLGEVPKARIKLSNAVIAANSVFPWFVVVFSFSRAGRVTGVYCAHVFGSVLTKMLSEAHLADAGGHSLHRHYCYLGKEHFQTVNPTELLNHMKSEISLVGPFYEGRKRELALSAGFEEVAVKGNMALAATSRNELVLNFLGLGEGLAVKQFEIQMHRFGLPLRGSQHSAADGEMKFSPHPCSDVALKIESLDRRDSVDTEGVIFAARMDETRMLRVSCGFLEIWGTLDGGFQYALKIEPNEKLRISQLLAAIFMRSHQSFHIEGWLPQGRIFELTAEFEIDPHAGEWANLLTVVRWMSSAIRPSIANGYKFSMKEFGLAMDELCRMHELLSTESLRFQVDSSSQFPIRPETILYYLSVNVGDWSVNALASRRILSFVPEHTGKIQFFTGPAELMQFFVGGLQREETPSAIQGAYDQYLQQVDHLPLLALGNLAENFSARRLDCKVM